MSFAACPRCHDEISVPLGVRPGARVRCPLCREEMLLSDILDRLPPMLEVLDAEDLQPAAAWQSGGESTYTPKDYSGYTDQEYAPAKEEHGAMGDMVAAATATAPAVGASTRIRKRKEANVVVEMVKIVLGGVFGIGLALPVLWWGLKKDPINLGPVVANYAPWAVPEQFRGKSSVPTNNPAPNPPVRPSPPSSPNKMPTTDPPAQTFNTPPAEPGKSPFDTALKKPVEVEQPTGPPGPSGPEVTATFGAVERAAEAFRDAADRPKGEQRQFASDLYDAFADAGAKLAAANQKDPDIAQGLAFGQAILKQAHTEIPASFLGFFASQRLDSGEDQAGVAVPAEVIELKAAGRWYEMKLSMLPSKKREVVAVFADNPQGQTKVGDTVLVLGSLEQNPGKLQGYRGNAESVVKGGMILVAEQPAE